MGTSTTAWVAVQGYIEAREAYDSIEYGIRSIQAGGPYGSCGAYAVQIREGCQAARRVTGEFVGIGDGTLRALRAAKKVAYEQLKAAEAEKREIGTARQIRLALAA